MTTNSQPIDSEKQAAGIGVRPGSLVRVQAQHRRVKRLGNWGASRALEVVATGSLVVLDLLVPEIEEGDIHIRMDLTRSTLKLLVPDGTQVDQSGLSWSGHGRIKDWTGSGSPDGRQIHLAGQMRSSEIRVHRGGIAIWSLWLAGQAREVRRAEAAGRLGARRPGR
ncbi:MAG: hypothetical protein ACYCO9_15090 [Streptosporangiaceae bacterium]